MTKNPKTQEQSLTTSPSTKDNISFVIINAEYSSFDKIFPFLNELLCNIRIPKISDFIFTVWLLIQLISMTFINPFILEYFKGKIITTILNIFSEIFLFSSSTLMKNNYLISFILFSFIEIAILIIFLLQIFYYQKKRNIIKWTLIISRLIFEISPKIALSPLSFNVGTLNLDLMTKQFTFLYSLYFIMNVFFLYLLVVI
jgi:hypothetical protein